MLGGKKKEKKKMREREREKQVGYSQWMRGEGEHQGWLR